MPRRKTKASNRQQLNRHLTFLSQSLLPPKHLAATTFSSWKYFKTMTKSQQPQRLAHVCSWTSRFQQQYHSLKQHVVWTQRQHTISAYHLQDLQRVRFFACHQYRERSSAGSASSMHPVCARNLLLSQLRIVIIQRIRDGVLFKKFRRTHWSVY
jgi:hypothetical protein